MIRRPPALFIPVNYTYEAHDDNLTHTAVHCTRLRSHGVDFSNVVLEGTSSANFISRIFSTFASEDGRRRRRGVVWISCPSGASRGSNGTTIIFLRFISAVTSCLFYVSFLLFFSMQATRSYEVSVPSPAESEGEDVFLGRL